MNSEVTGTLIRLGYIDVRLLQHRVQIFLLTQACVTIVERHECQQK